MKCSQAGCEALPGLVPREAKPQTSLGAGALICAMLSLKLPRLLSINQVPKVREELFFPKPKAWQDLGR